MLWDKQQALVDREFYMHANREVIVSLLIFLNKMLYN